MSTRRNQPYATLQEMITTVSDHPSDRVVNASCARIRRRLDTNLARRGAGVSVGVRPLLVPAVVVAALLFAAGVFVGSQRRGFDLAAGRERTVNVHVSVDAEHTDELLSWLNGQDQVGQINVSLPDQAEFRFQGAPVLLRASRHHPAPTEGGPTGENAIVPAEGLP